MLTSHDPKRAIGAIALCALAVLLFPLVWVIPSAPASVGSLALAEYPAPSDNLFLPFVERGIPTATNTPIPASTSITTPTPTITPTRTPTAAPTACPSVPYNETLFYNMDKINAPEAWPCAAGGEGVIIAILDTGADSDHTDLLANLVAGAYWPAYSTSPEDDNGHGTHVSGIAAGVANNDGILGVAPLAKIMPVKVLNSSGSGSIEAEASGIIWAVDHGAKVINMSLSGPSYFQVEYDAVVYAYNHGVVIICAAGNSGDSTIMYPAAFAEVIAVAAIDSNDYWAYFLTYGNWVDVSAPGMGIISSYPWYTSYGLYDVKDGTSMAVPHVAGMAALIRKLRPSWTVDQVHAHIRSSVDDMYPWGYDPWYGWGRINAQKAVNALSLAATDALPVPEPVQSMSAPVTGDPAEFSPGVVLFKLRPGIVLSAVLGEAGINAAGLQASVAVAALDVMQLHVPAGEELYWLKHLRSLPDVAYAELDGIRHL